MRNSSHAEPSDTPTVRFSVSASVNGRVSRDGRVVIRAWRDRLSLRRTKRSRRAPFVDGTRHPPGADDTRPQAPVGDLAQILNRAAAMGIDPKRVLVALGVSPGDELIDGTFRR
jgi:hypothetical protein